MTTDDEKIGRAIRSVFESPNEFDRNMEAANVVDGLFAIARAVEKLADAIEKRDTNQSASHPPPTPQRATY